MPKCFAENNHVFVSVKGTTGLCCGIHRPRFNTIKEFKQSDFYNEWKETMKDGWHPACQSCQKKEEVGLNSKRSYYEKCKYFVEYSADNTCNLSCVMCDENFSSTWERKKGIKSKNKEFEDTDKIEWEKIDLFKYMGGEPFMTPNLLDILKKIPDEATINLSTNLTFFPKEKILNELKRFATVKLSCSIDGIDDVFEYIRNGAKWKECKENLLKFKESDIFDTLTIVMTLQALNVHDVANVIHFAKENDIQYTINFLFTPVGYTVEALPLNYRELIKDEYNEKFLNAPFIPERFEKLKEAIEYNKNVLGSDINKIPEIRELIDYVN